MLEFWTIQLPSRVKGDGLFIQACVNLKLLMGWSGSKIRLEQKINFRPETADIFYSAKFYLTKLLQQVENSTANRLILFWVWRSPALCAKAAVFVCLG